MTPEAHLELTRLAAESYTGPPTGPLIELRRLWYCTAVELGPLQCRWTITEAGREALRQARVCDLSLYDGRAR